MQQQQLDFIRHKSRRTAPKITPAPRTRMGPQAHAKLPGQSDTGFHRLQVAAVSAASHVGRGDPTHKGPSARQGLLFTQIRSEEHTSELQSLAYLVCRLLLEKKKQDDACF